MASIDIRSSAGQTDMDVGDLDSTFRGHDEEDGSGDHGLEGAHAPSTLPPLFLQLSVTLKQKGKVIATSNIKTLPTCFNDLYSIAAKNECFNSEESKEKAFGEKRNFIENLDQNQISATLDLVCISLPQNLLNFPQQYFHDQAKNRSLSDTKASSNDNSNTKTTWEAGEKSDNTLPLTISEWKDSFSDHQKTLTSFNSLMDGDTENWEGDEKLPEVQQEIVKSLISNIKWMMEDEIAFAMIRDVDGSLKNVKEEVLITVADHVEVSGSQSGCVFQNISLNFVFGPERAYDMFLSSVFEGQITPTGFRLTKVGNKGFYLLHVLDENNSHSNEKITKDNINQLLPQQDKLDDTSAQRDITIENSDDITLEKGAVATACTGQTATRFNLSPVKEVQGHISPPKSEHLSENDVMHKGDKENIENISKKSSNQKRANNYPNSWLILKIDDESVKIYFQYREGQFDAVLPWRQAQQSTVAKIKTLCKGINQKLMLQELFESRTCHRLLESVEEVWHIEAGGKNAGTKAGDDLVATDLNDPDEGYEATPLEIKLNMRFRPGTFSCPKVWEAEFNIHPRLLQTSQGMQLSNYQGPGGGSRAFHAFTSSLGPFFVNDRSNLFVYQDTSPERNIYYMKVLEIINKSSNVVGNVGGQGKIKAGIHGSSLKLSINKSPKKVVLDNETNASTLEHPKRRNEYNTHILDSGESKNLELRSKSDSLNNYSNDEDKIVMQIYGLQHPGPDITNDFYVMLKNKLNDKVIEVMSVMLQRNSKLTPNDVLFLQPRRSKCNFHLLFRISPLVIKYQASFIYYLRQNLLHGGTIVEPKYTNPDICFQDYDDDGNEFSQETEASISAQSLRASDVFLHNGGRGHKELACIAVAHLVDELMVNDGNWKKDNNSELEYDKWRDMLHFHVTDSMEKEKQGLGSDQGRNGLTLRFRVWTQSRSGSNFEFQDLRQELKKKVEHSLWDIVTESCLLIEPLNVKSDPPDVSVGQGADSPGKELNSSKDATLSPIYSQNAVDWFEMGLKLRAASMAHYNLKFKVGGSRDSFHGFGGLSWLKELQHQIELSIPDLKTNPFVLCNNNSIAVFKTCNGLFTSTTSTDVKEGKERKASLASSYLIVGQNQRHWKACTNTNIAEINVTDLVPKQLSSHQNFQPLVVLAETKINQDNLEECTAEIEEPSATVVASGKGRFRGRILSLFSPTSSHCTSPLVTPGTPTNPAFPALSSQDRSNSLLKDAISIASSAGTEDGFEIREFIPRQHLVMVRIQRCTVSIYMYNLSKECVERLIKSTNNLSCWIEARSALAVSIAAQKAGLFHHQTFFKVGMVDSKDKKSNARSIRKKSSSMLDGVRDRKTSAASTLPISLSVSTSASPLTMSSLVHTNPYINDASYIETLVKNIAPPKQPHTGSNLKSPLTSNYGGNKSMVGNTKPSMDNVFPEVYRDLKPETPIISSASVSGKPNDVLLSQGTQLLELHAADKKHIMRSLWYIWSTFDQKGHQTKVDSEIWTEEVLDHFEKIGTLHHLEFTPLLFLPKWRQVAKDTNDQLQTLFGKENYATLLAKKLRDVQNQENTRHNYISLQDTFQQDMYDAVEKKFDEVTPPKIIGRSSSVSNKGSFTGESMYSHASIIRNFFQELTKHLQKISNLDSVKLSNNGRKGSTPEPSAVQTPSSINSSPSSRGRSLSGGHRKSSISRHLITHCGGLEPNDEKLGINYLYKAFEEGILLLKISISPPYTVIGLYALDASQIHQYAYNNPISKKMLNIGGNLSPTHMDLHLLKGRNKGGSIRRNKFQEQLSQYCDDLKKRMFIDAFSYDYHLKLIHTHVNGANSGLKLLAKHQNTNIPLIKKGFNVVEFLKEFSTEDGYYYNQPINANTLLGCQLLTLPISIQRSPASEIVSDPSSLNESQILYDYLLAHEFAFKFRLMKMDNHITNNLSDIIDEIDSRSALPNYAQNKIDNSKCILTRQALYRLEWKCVGLEEDEVIKTKDLGVTLIVCHKNEDVSRKSIKDGNRIQLKYFVVVTPKAISSPASFKSWDRYQHKNSVTLKPISTSGLSSCGVANSLASPVKER